MVHKEVCLCCIYILCVFSFRISVFILYFLSLCLQHGLFTVVHKHYSPEAWKQFASENKDALKVIVICCSSLLITAVLKCFRFDCFVD